jgi:parallel beta-helix repeat protein
MRYHVWVGHPSDSNLAARHGLELLVALLLASSAVFWIEPAGALATEGHLTIAVDTVLTEDHRGTIAVAGGVALDCAGHTVTPLSDEATSGPGISILTDGATIRNCLVVGFEIGIEAESSSGISNVDNQVSDSVRLSMVTGNGIGIQLEYVTDSVVSGNRSTDNEGRGFDILGDRITVTDNTASGNYAEGFLVYGSTIELRGNTASTNSVGFGISGTNHTVSHNTAMSNEHGGIETELVTNSTFEFNDSSSNGSGFIDFDGQDNTYTGNTANANAGWGFWRAGEGGINDSFDSNRCVNNGQGGSAMSSPNGPDPVEIDICSESGTFGDDDDSVFELDIKWLGDSGITKGCNPPTNNMYCPDSTVTRGQMAAFLHRALG